MEVCERYRIVRLNNWNQSLQINFQFMAVLGIPSGLYVSPKPDPATYLNAALDPASYLYDAPDLDPTIWHASDVVSEPDPYFDSCSGSMQAEMVHKKEKIML
jgi:hypothetical protein